MSHRGQTALIALTLATSIGVRGAGARELTSTERYMRKHVPELVLFAERMRRNCHNGACRQAWMETAATYRTAQSNLRWMIKELPGSAEYAHDWHDFWNWLDSGDRKLVSAWMPSKSG